jgi:hypothetical protein
MLVLGPATGFARMVFLLLQQALAAAVAWVLATHVVDHHQPFFAPMAAVVASTLRRASAAATRCDFCRGWSSGSSPASGIRTREGPKGPTGFEYVVQVGDGSGFARHRGGHPLEMLGDGLAGLDPGVVLIPLLGVLAYVIAAATR